MDIRLDPHFQGPSANNARQPDIIDLDQFLLQLFRQHPQGCVVPHIAGPWLRRQRERDNRHIIDSPPDDERHRHACRNSIQIGPDLFVHAQDRVIGIGADIEPRRHQCAVIPALRIDVLDVRNRLDDFLKRLCHLFDHICGAQARR